MMNLLRKMKIKNVIGENGFNNPEPVNNRALRVFCHIKNISARITRRNVAESFSKEDTHNKSKLNTKVIDPSIFPTFTSIKENKQNTLMFVSQWTFHWSRLQLHEMERFVLLFCHFFKSEQFILENSHFLRQTLLHAFEIL